jgi:(S)-2-hydroxyglutarate dehydrogenase
VAERSAVVVGAGVVGLATARELLLRHPGLRLTVLEKEREVGAHQTGHNSGVVHSGVYYMPGSLRARTCVVGSQMLVAWCAERGVPVQRRGKLIVAVDEDELPRLEELRRRGEANGVETRLLDAAAMREVEPHVAGLRALQVPSTATVDFRLVARALADEVHERGGAVRCGVRVRRLRADGSAAAVVETDQGDVTVDAAVVCAGLQSDRLAREVEPGGPSVVPFRGDYWVLRPERADLVRGLVYPVPDPALPFLGVHATRRPDEAVWLGPNAVPALAREGYRRGALDRHDLGEMARDAGVLRLMARHWRSGLAELARDRGPRLLLRALRRYLPELRLEDVLPGPCGVRAQAVSRDGRLLDDFLVSGAGRVVHVRNAPSPAATACLAIARLVADEVDARLAP